jgi:phosphate transport system protein
MAREAYQQALTGLQLSVVELGRQVRRQLQRGLDILLRHDCAAAGRMDRDDDVIDRETLRIEKACIDLVALQQPVAADMRLITASYKIITDLERIADLGVNLADYCCAAVSVDMVDASRFLAVGRLGMDMLEQAMAAYELKDANLAEQVIQRDQELDELTWGTMHEFLEQLGRTGLQGHDEAEARRIASQALPVLLSMRDLERVGDHACNIAGRVVFMVTASDRYL